MTSLYIGFIQLIGNISFGIFYYLCAMEMFGELSAFELLLVGGAIVGAWVKYQVDYSKTKATFVALETKTEARVTLFEASVENRMSSIEEDRQETKADLKHILEEIQEIKLLLAKNKLV